MKSTPMPRWNESDTMVDQYGNIHTLYADRSIPPTAIDAKQIADICNQLGTVYHGTLIAGSGDGTDKKAARVVVGQLGQGIQAYDDASRNFFSLNWEDQSFRLGYIDAPQVRIRNGNVEIDGDCIIDGTLTAAKLMTTGTVRLLVESGLLAFGSGDATDPTGDDPFSGVRASDTMLGSAVVGGSLTLQRISQFAGWDAGVMTWGVDNTDGSIRSMGAGAPDEVYARLSEGALELSNIAEFDGLKSEIAFISHTFDSAGVDSVTTIGLSSSGNALALRSVTNSEFPYLALRNSLNQTGGIYGTSWLNWENGSATMSMNLSPWGNVALQLPTQQSLIDIFGVIRAQYGIRCFGSLLHFDQGVSWPARPDAPTDQQMILHPDPVNHRMELWTGVEWVYLQTAAA